MSDNGTGSRNINIYYAAPLFNEIERRSNEDMARRLRAYGFTVYLPQETGRVSEGMSREDCFCKDLTALNHTDVVIADLRGRVPDEGTVWEIGYAYGHGRPVIAFVDEHSFINGHQNNMIEQGCNVLWNETPTEESFNDFTEEIINLAKNCA